jgi:hypothetical protein
MRREKLAELAKGSHFERTSFGIVTAGRLRCLRLMCGTTLMSFWRSNENFDASTIACPKCKLKRLKCVETFQAEIEANAAAGIVRYRRMGQDIGPWQYLPADLGKDAVSSLSEDKS